MSKSNQTVGIILILVGIVGVLNYYFDFNLFSMARLWPIFLLIPGLAFEISYFTTRKAAGLLVPGGILLTLGCVFIFHTYTNWHFAGVLWPLYVLAPAVGLLQLYCFGGGNKGLLIPISVLLMVVALGFVIQLGIFINTSLVAPIVIIVLGILLLFAKNNDEGKTL